MLDFDFSDLEIRVKVIIDKAKVRSKWKSNKWEIAIWMLFPYGYNRNKNFNLEKSGQISDLKELTGAR